MKKSKRSIRKKPISDATGEEAKPLKSSPQSLHSSISMSRENMLAASTVVGIAYLAMPLLGGFEWNNLFVRQQPIPKAFKPEQFVKSNAESVEKRLMEEWQPGDNIKIQNVEDNEKGLFANYDIPKGSVITSVDFPDLEQELVEEFPTVRPIVQNALDQALSTYSNGWSTVTAGKVLSLIKFLIEDAKGEESVWHSFSESCPKNVTNMAWYWNADERACVVPRPGGDALHQDLLVFHSTLDQVRRTFETFGDIYNRERAEWAYLMLKTRGFGQYFLPVLHLANHNPLKGVPAFIIPSSGTAAYIAPQNIRRDEPIFTDYGELTPVASAEQYGFVEEEPAFVEIPAIFEDLLTNEKTKNERLCTRKPMKFFGNVQEQVIEAKYGNGRHSTYFKVSLMDCHLLVGCCCCIIPNEELFVSVQAFMPTELAYACIRVVLQTERDTDVAAYIHDKIEYDLKRYKAMLDNPHCQSSEGNFPLIRQANEATAKLLEGTLQKAADGRDWKIPYPDIPTYIMNYPE